MAEHSPAADEPHVNGGIDEDRRIKELARRAEETVRERAEQLRERAEKVSAQARDVYDDAYEKLDIAQRYVVERVQERPLVSTLAAVGVGLLIGLVVAGGRRR
jgi:ElaB/YqjD/DUF883 family membrane-anchored ribosome-binding protein